MNDGTMIRTQPEGSVQAECIDASDDALFLERPRVSPRSTLPDLEPLREDENARRLSMRWRSTANRCLAPHRVTGKFGKRPTRNGNNCLLTVAASSLSFGFGETFWVTATR